MSLFSKGETGDDERDANWPAAGVCGTKQLVAALVMNAILLKMTRGLTAE